VTDNEGKTASCTAQVSVEDKIPPTVVCKDHNLYLDASGKGTLNPSEVNNGSTDNCTAGLFFYLSRTDFTCKDIDHLLMSHLLAPMGQETPHHAFPE
jgi:hypothetical protein